MSARDRYRKRPKGKAEPKLETPKPKERAAPMHQPAVEPRAKDEVEKLDATREQAPSGDDLDACLTHQAPTVVREPDTEDRKRSIPPQNMGQDEEDDVLATVERPPLSEEAPLARLPPAPHDEEDMATRAVLPAVSGLPSITSPPPKRQSVEAEEADAGRESRDSFAPVDSQELESIPLPPLQEAQEDDDEEVPTDIYNAVDPAAARLKAPAPVPEQEEDDDLWGDLDQAIAENRADEASASPPPAPVPEREEADEWNLGEMSLDGPENGLAQTDPRKADTVQTRKAGSSGLGSGILSSFKSILPETVVVAGTGIFGYAAIGSQWMGEKLGGNAHVVVYVATALAMGVSLVSALDKIIRQARGNETGDD